MMGIVTEGSTVESRAVDECFLLERKYPGTLDAQKTESLVEKLRELVPPGTYTGLFGVIHVRGLSYVPEGGAFSDVMVDWSYPSGERGDPLGVIHFLEFYRRFEPHLL